MDEIMQRISAYGGAFAFGCFITLLVATIIKIIVILIKERKNGS